MPFGPLLADFYIAAARGGRILGCLVQVSLQATAVIHPNFTPGFILARLGADANRPLFFAPMSRSEGIILLRQLFFIPLLFDPCCRSSLFLEYSRTGDPTSRICGSSFDSILEH